MSNLDTDVNPSPIPDTNPGSSDLELGSMAEEMIRLRILHTFTIYPKLSPSMLQIGIGTGYPPALWHPVLESLIAAGIVSRTQVQATNPVSKRDQTYTILEAIAQPVTTTT